MDSKIDADDENEEEETERDRLGGYRIVLSLISWWVVAVIELAAPWTCPYLSATASSVVWIYFKL